MTADNNTHIDLIPGNVYLACPIAFPYSPVPPSFRWILVLEKTDIGHVNIYTILDDKGKIYHQSEWFLEEKYVWTTLFEEEDDE